MRLTVLIALLGILTSCVTGASYLTKADIETFGTKEFNTPKSKVFDATSATLKTLGFEIAVSDKSKGQLVTKKQLVGTKTKGYVDSGGSVTANTNAGYRQYDIKITEVNGKSRLVATPRIYVDATDVSDQEQWLLDGPGGEKAKWATLFQGVQSNL
jgi:hypothetical protein